MNAYPRKILLATDGSEDSRRAARVAAALAASSGAELHLVCVGQEATPSTGVTVEGGSLPGQPPGYAEKQTRRLLDRQAEELRVTGGTITDAHLRMGQPPVEVALVAQEIGADLIVVGSGGPRVVRRVVASTTRQAAIGRVSSALVRTAPCPVLVARGETPTEPGS